MTGLARFAHRALWIIAAVIVSGCAHDYAPADGPRIAISVEDARAVVKASLRPSFKRLSTAVFVTTGSVTIVDTERNSAVRIPLRDVDVFGSGHMLFVLVRGQDILKTAAGFNPVWYEQKDLEKYVDAWLTLKQAAIVVAANEQTRFEEALRAAKSGAALGGTAEQALPEEARQFKVQAEGAVRDKQFDEAANYYGRALAEAPGWAAGYFNRALTLSEVWDFPDAIVDMKRYLALAPDAPDARAAQDKIYDWQRRSKQ